MRYIISFLLTSVALGSSAMAQTPKVVADTVTTHALTSLVMGDLGTPQILLEQGANPHDVQLRPSQARSLSQADLVIWLGPEMTPWLDRALDGLAAKTPRLSLLHSAGTLIREYDAPEGGDAAHAHEDHSGHDGESHAAHDNDEQNHDDHAHSKEGHSHAGLDPHAWLDPTNAQVWLKTIASELSALDPAQSATYIANAEAAAREIKALDQRLQAQLAPIHDKPFVTFHEAYGYLIHHFGLTSAGAIALGDATAPGAARLTALSDALKAGKAECLFPEAQHDPVQAQRLSEASGVKLGPALDPEGSAITPGPQAYAALMQGLADSLTSCLQQ